MSKVRLTGATSGYTELAAPATAGNNTLVLPGGNGTAGQVLQTNGSGALSWAHGAASGPVFDAVSFADQSVAELTYVKMTTDTEVIDTANCYASSRFTPNVAGYYSICATLQYTGAATAGILFAVACYKNGLVHRELAVGTTTAQFGSISGATIIYLNGSTDYVEIYGKQNTSGAKNMKLVQFSGFLARPA